jgi:hypothetical protein
MQKFLQTILHGTKRIAIATLLLLVATLVASAQSTNIEFPTPVTSGEISGEIIARDIGDPRLTRYFYLLTGTPGDLFLTVESNNLNGDVDLFTAGTLRPLAKLSMYAGLSTSSTSRSIYLRRRETLILRVEARSANDDPGRYRIRFSGGFEPLAETTPAPESVEPTVSTSRDKNARRVNSAGARVNEEPPAVASSGLETLPPATTVRDEEEVAAASKPEATEPAKPAPTRPTRTPRTGRTRTPRNTRRTPTTTAKKTEPPAATTTDTTPAPAATEARVGPRLIIETTDGMRVEHYMSQVRRMTVEKGLLIVVTNDGKIERRAMSNILRVTIEP